MASPISIIKQPINPLGVYKPNPFVVLSTNVENTYFKYFVDVYAGTISPTDFKGRYFFAPRLNTAGIGIFSPSNILANEVQFIFYPAVVGFYPTYEAQTKFKLDFGEQYLASPGDSGVTSYSALTTISDFSAFNATRQIEDSQNYNDYIYNGSTQHKLLTDWNIVYPKRIREGEYESLGVYMSNSTHIRLSTFNSASTLISSYVINTGYNALYDSFDIGVGTQNLISYITSNVYYYTISVGTSGASHSVDYGYILDRECYKYEPVRIAWQNQYGKADYFTFIAKSVKSITAKSQEWEKMLSYEYSVGDRTRTNLYTDATKQIVVTTDWIEDYEAEFLNHCKSSNNHFIITSTGGKIPVILKNFTQESKTVDNDKLFNYQFTFEYAYPIKTTRT